MFTRTGLLALVGCVFCGRLLAADPTGTWQWESQELHEQGVLQNTLVLKNDRGTLTGFCPGPTGQNPVKTIAFDEDQLTWILEVEVRGQQLLARFSGKLTGDELRGQVVLGSLGKYSWRAQRDVNAAGVWRWESKNVKLQKSIQHVLTLKKDNENLVGTYTGENGDVAVQNVTVQGDQLRCDVNTDVHGQNATMIFSGKITDDGITGVITRNGQPKIPWQARRHTDQTGTNEQHWRFYINIPDGSVYSPVLHFAKTNDGMVGRFSNDQGAVLPVEDLAVSRNGQFFFNFDLTVLGIKSQFYGQFHDESAEGMVDYDHQGDTGQSTFTAQRIELN